jgi:hypothetical protein
VKRPVEAALSSATPSHCAPVHTRARIPAGSRASAWVPTDENLMIAAYERLLDGGAA